jgi:dinuclear metal center YbgI/SA1388 family protein
MKMKAPTVKQLTALIEEIAPVSIAMPGDPVGLQCGDPAGIVKRVMYSLDAGMDVVGQAVKKGADLLVSHHPMIFEPLDHHAVTGNAGAPVVVALRGGLAVYCAHTNLDASPRGINAHLARLVDLQEPKLLSTTGPDRFKVVVFIPGRSLQKVRAAAFGAGAGHIGSYSNCSFSTSGTGTFFGEDGSSPVVGETGRLEEVPELKLELLVDSDTLAPVLGALRGAHPYEEAAIDVYPLAQTGGYSGLGLVGNLPEKATVRQVVAGLKSALKIGAVRVVGAPGRQVRKVAVCAGSGSSLLGAAASAGAQLFITGDLKYHEARSAQELGIVLLDIGHFAPERYGMKRFATLLGRHMTLNGWQVESTFARESDPFVFLP